MQNFLVEVTQTTTTTFSVPAEDQDEALARHAERGVPIHSEANVSAPVIVGVE